MEAYSVEFEKLAVKKYNYGLRMIFDIHFCEVLQI